MAASSPYSTLKSRPVTADASAPTFGTDPSATHQLVGNSTGGGLGYQLPNLRQGGDTTTINTTGNLSIPERINVAAQNQFVQGQAGLQAQGMALGAAYGRTLNALPSLTSADRNVIFDSWRNQGLLPQRQYDMYSQGWVDQQRSNANGGRANADLTGAFNRLGLLTNGINPNIITNAYNSLVGS